MDESGGNFEIRPYPVEIWTPKVGVLEIFAFFESHHIFSTFSAVVLHQQKVSGNGKLCWTATDQGYITAIKLFLFPYNLTTINAIEARSWELPKTGFFRENLE